MFFFRREPPPPPEKPFYRKNPVATAAVFLTFVGMFVLGPVGAVYKGLTEDLKAKANNETILLYMKQQKETDDRQWKAIEQSIQRPQSVQVREQPVVKEKTITRRAPASETQQQEQGPPPLTPKHFEDYMNMSPEHRAAFRKLHPAYANLPE